jgi:hypothetical protein
MWLPQARSLMMRYKFVLYLTGAVLASLIGPAAIYYNHGIVESKTAAIGDGKDKHKKKKDGNREFDPASISSKIFQGGIFEASDVVAVPGTDGVLFVDDTRPD